MTWSTLSHPVYGTFTFVSMTPPPMLTRTQGIVEVRPGVDGYGVWKEARRGTTWTPSTFVDTFSVATAYAVQRQYELAPFTGIWTCRWELGPPFEVVCTSVGGFEIRRVIGAVGGTLGIIGRATIRAQWRFLTS